MREINEMRLEFAALPENEAFARLAISGFMLPLDPTMEQLADVKTAVSEAVTNAIVHGYGGTGGRVVMCAAYGDGGELEIRIIDQGRGIEDIQRARQPFFTTCRGEDRSGMGFTVMESFMDDVDVQSTPGEGTIVIMTKRMRMRDDAIPHEA